MAESRCLFCKKTAAEERGKAGKTLCKDGLTVHQYCLYFAAGLYQRGEEKEGINGFLLPDIRRESNRAAKLTCRFCHTKGAATGCVVQSCRQMCHAPCGMKNGFLLQHHGRFEAFCPVHRPFQSLELVQAACLKTDNCCLCLSAIGQSRFEILVCPACETGFHRSCLQQQAWLGGVTFFRCSVCSDRERFIEEMLRMGLEIPEHDTGNGSEGECKAENCLCPDGRTFYTSFSKYRLKTCQNCNKTLGHMVCVKGRLCSTCKPQIPSVATTTSPSHPTPNDNRHKHNKVGVAKPKTAPSPTKCDCSICLSKKCQSSDEHSPPTSSVLPSPLFTSPPSYTSTSTPPTLSPSQPTPPHPTSRLLPTPPPSTDSAHNTPSSTAAAPKRSFSPSEIAEIASTLPVIPQTTPTLVSSMIAQPPTRLSSLSVAKATPSAMGVPLQSRGGLTHPLHHPYLHFHTPHFLCSHLQAAAAAAMGIPHTPHFPAFPGSPYFHTLFPHAPIPYPHVIPRPLQTFPVPAPPVFNPIPTRHVAPPTLPPRPATTQVNPSPIVTSLPVSHPTLTQLLNKKAQTSLADLAICSYFDYVDVPSDVFASLDSEPNKEKLSNGPSEVGTSRLRMGNPDERSVTGIECHTSESTSTKSGTVCSETEEKTREDVSLPWKQSPRQQRLKKRKFADSNGGPATPPAPLEHAETKRPKSDNLEISLARVTKSDRVNRSEEVSLLTRIPLSSLSPGSQRRLRNGWITKEFLRGRGMRVRSPCLALHRMKQN